MKRLYSLSGKNMVNGIRALDPAFMLSFVASGTIKTFWVTWIEIIEEIVNGGERT